MDLKTAISKYRLVKRKNWSGSFVVGADGGEYKFNDKLYDFVKTAEKASLSSPGIVRSLYHHRSGLIGSSPELALPVWLEESLNLNKSNRLSQKIPVKGTEGSHVPARCSAESAYLAFSPDILEVPFFSRPEALCAGVRGELAPGLVLVSESFGEVNKAGLGSGGLVAMEPGTQISVECNASWPRMNVTVTSGKADGKSFADVGQQQNLLRWGRF